MIDAIPMTDAQRPLYEALLHHARLAEEHTATMQQMANQLGTLNRVIKDMEIMAQAEARGKNQVERDADAIDRLRDTETYYINLQVIESLRLDRAKTEGALWYHKIMARTYLALLGGATGGDD